MAGLYCKGASPICIRPASRGGACGENSCDCTSFCDDATKTCQAPPAVGDPCTGIAECGLALDCVNGQCAAPGAVGDPCDGGAAVPCQSGAGLEGSVACMNGICTSTATGASLACASP
jgi:hypothetical protein